MKFAKEFLISSNNIENQRHTIKEQLSRISTQRLCAGPAVPLLYSFYAQGQTDLLDKPFEDVASKDVIKNYQTNKICQKAV